jgi:hypothetical protein
VELLAFGRVTLDLCTTDFLTWLGDGRRRDRWSDPQTFVPDLLAQRSVEAKDARRLHLRRPARLNPEALEEIAGLIAAKSGSSFLPRQVIARPSFMAVGFLGRCTTKPLFFRRGST